MKKAIMKKWQFFFNALSSKPLIPANMSKMNLVDYFLKTSKYCSQKSNLHE